MKFNAVEIFAWGFDFLFKYIWPYCGLKALLSCLLPILPRSLLVKPHISETAIGSSSTIYLSPSAIYQISIHTSMGACLVVFVAPLQTIFLRAYDFSLEIFDTS